MIIINNRPGQLGNQLWLNAPFIALCLDNDLLYLNLYFENNYHLFENLNIYKKIKFGLVAKIFDIYTRKILLRLIQKIPSRLLKWLNIYIDKENWRNEKWDLKILTAPDNIVFAGGIAYNNSHELLLKHHNELTKIFAPQKESREKINQVFCIKRRNTDLVIGLHIRRGDYKDFLNGVYYFNDDVYLTYIQQLTQQIESNNQTVAYCICANEPINLQSFAPHNVFQVTNATNIEDMFALSCCDYILGVPSTFSMWASFYGKVPLRFIKNENESIGLDQFSKIIAQDTFENGQKLVHAVSK